MRFGRWVLFVGGLAGLVWLGAVALAGWMDADNPFKKRFARYPPEVGFEFVFGHQPPAGVAELRSTGEFWLAGTNLWLTFRADPAVTDELFGDWKRPPSPTPAERRELRGMHDEALSGYDPKGTLRWNELYDVRRSREYRREHPDGYTEATVDVPTNRVYVFRWGQ